MTCAPEPKRLTLSALGCATDRFFDQEVVGFSDGGHLDWRVGDVGGKCNGCPCAHPHS